MIVRDEADLRQAMQLDSESEHVEFKEAKNNFHFEELADYCCALANEGGGSIVLGVSDKPPRKIVGTKVFESLDRAKIGLFERLHWRVDAVEILTAEGRVVSFIVPGRPRGRPLNCKGRYLMRAGSSLQAMSLEQMALILNEAQVDFSADLVPGADQGCFDPEAVEEFRARWQRKSGRAEIQHWTSAKLLEDAELTVDGAPTYAGLILLGTEKRPRVIWLKPKRFLNSGARRHISLTSNVSSFAADFSLGTDVLLESHQSAQRRAAVS